MAKKDAKKEGKGELITKGMTLEHVIREYPQSAEVLFSHGLHCIGCHIAATETLEQASQAHGIDLDALLKDLNKAAKEAKKD